ncbi:thiol reductant ABC exporter subunit CydC [Aciditerrimonas ferrireducens]|jgi:thiol reductant ABC exporter CydC subunit|uniref:thiol reductant ABC exporter subunit CydC n=1 Tax=Aciditerrimonas ferrireducens TaxID=667306 RepID=UPI00200648C1|nr:thiol reductant ABC exporter subunit CydC [Aciditerrimonas ferrireducens]MCK4177146.1 thiol reductant ABC exporter subunit CydC [Aciditerrimonas ferrireducens]
MRAADAAGRWRGELGRGALAVGVGLAGQVSALGLLATSAWLLTRASLRPPILTLSVAIAAVRFFALARGLGRYGERLAGHDAALRVLARLRVWVYRHLEPLVPGGLGGVREGDVLVRVVGDVDAVLDLLVGVLVPSVTGVVSAALAVALAGLVLPAAAPVVAGGLLLGGVLVSVGTLVAGRRVAGTLGAARAEVTARVVETLAGAPDLLAFGAAAQVARSLNDTEARSAQALRRQALVRGGGFAGWAFAAGGTLAGVLALGLGAVRSPDGGAGLSGVGLAVLAFTTLAAFDALAPLPDALARAGAEAGSAARLRALADLEPPVHPPAEPVPLPPGPLSVELDAVTVRYPGRRSPALQEVSLALPPGRRLAVVGPSGAGKSTLALVLLRFVEPEAGRLVVGGIDAARLDPEAVRQRVAYAPQDPHVFRGSLAANLRLARPEASDEELLAVLVSLGLGPWFERLPAGLASELGERGVRVSGGERQRLGIARALLARRPLVVLDEPTAHLDDRTEDVVRATVLEATRGASLVWITHQLAGLDAFDEVIALEDGRCSPAPEVQRLAGALWAGPQ